MNMYLDLIFTFMKVGAFTFGGGYAMLPLLQKEIVDNKHWATNEELMDYFAIGQCTPGAIAVNTATFIGFNKKGVLGGIMATLGVIFPSICIILIIAILLHNFADLAIIQHALVGIRIGVCVLILNAIINLFKAGIKDSIGKTIFLFACIFAYFSLLPTIAIILLCAIIGVLVKLYRKEGQQ